MNQKPSASESLNRPLSVGTLIAFSLPALVSSIMHGPAGSILPGIMAIHYGVDLAAIGTILLVVRLFDAVTDPMIGFFSDHTKTRWGRRKPWIVAGYAVALIGMFFLYVPQGSPTVIYFGAWFCILYLGWTMAEIPLQAWNLEISRSPTQRSRLAGYRLAIAAVGGLAFSLTPLLPIFETSEFTPDVLEFIFYVCLVALPIAVVVQVRFVPSGPVVATTDSMSPIRFAKEAWRNKPFLWLLAVQLISVSAAGMQAAGLFIWLDRYLQVGDKLPYILALSMGSGIVLIPLCIPIVKSLNHLRALILGGIGAYGTMIALFFLQPGAYAFPFLMLGMITFSMSAALGQVATPALIGDIVDYDVLRSKQDKSGQFTSIIILIAKSITAVGSALVFYWLAAFNVDVQSGSFEGLQAFGLKASVTLLPGVIGLLTLLLYVFFPLKPRHGEIIRRRLAKRAARAARAEAGQVEAKIESASLV